MPIERFVPRTALVAVLASAAVAIPLVASAGADNASKGSGKCVENVLCVWQFNEGSGQLVKIKGHGISNKLKEKMNNGASSVINGLSTRVILYDKANGEGDKLCLNPGEEEGSLANRSFNDLASSSKNTNNNSDCPL